MARTGSLSIRRRRAGRVVAWTCGAVLLVAVAGAAWIGVRGYLALQHLESARSAADGAAALLSDPATAPALITELSAQTSAARALTSDPVWGFAEMLPWVGPQLSAVSTVSAALDDIAGDTLTPLAEIAATFSPDTIRLENGRIDLAPLSAIAPAAETSSRALTDAHDALAHIDESTLLGPIRTAVTDVEALVDEAGGGIDALHRASELVPSMLGADGQRDYLVLFQNNAEWRSLGGNVGALLQLHTDAGSISLTAQASSSDFPRYDEPVLPLSDEEIRLFGRQPALFVQNLTQIPDFTRGGPLAREMWLRETGTDVDGVIALDPVALATLLQATGPVTLPTGEILTSDNAVPLLLNEVYQRYPVPAMQDAFFASAAASVFTALAGGAASPAALLDALTQAGDEGRLLVWSADADEQSTLDGTTLQGALPSDAQETVFGVYANDATSSKMDFYQSLDTSAIWCSAGEAELRVTIRNSAPDDVASLPDYLTGGAQHGVPVGDTKTVTYVYLPQGATLLAADPQGSTGETTIGGGVDAGHDVLIWTSQISPGGTGELTVRVATEPGGDLRVRRTPTISTSNESLFASTCSIPE